MRTPIPGPAAAVVAALLAAHPAAGQQRAAPPPAPAAASPPVPYGAPVGMEAARRAMTAAAEATRNGWGVAVAVADAGGHLAMPPPPAAAQPAGARPQGGAGGPAAGEQAAMVEAATMMFPRAVEEEGAFTPPTAFAALAREMASNARLATLAGLCGLRDAAWAGRVLGWVAAAHDAMARTAGPAWADGGRTGARNFARGLAHGARAAAREEHAARGDAACDGLRPAEALRTPDDLAAAVERGETPGAPPPRAQGPARPAVVPAVAPAAPAAAKPRSTARPRGPKGRR